MPSVCCKQALSKSHISNSRVIFDWVYVPVYMTKYNFFVIFAYPVLPVGLLLPQMWSLLFPEMLLPVQLIQLVSHLIA